MSLGVFQTPCPLNETVKSYVPGSVEKKLLKEEIERQLKLQVEVPLIIGGQEVRTGKVKDIRCPHDHKHKLGTYHNGTEEHAKMAIKAAMDASKTWSKMPWESRAAIFIKAAELLAGPYRYVLNAATMLGQSKNVYQAEIDSACELIDFWRYNPVYMQRIYESQPPANAPQNWNRVEYRPLEGFVFAVTPFNFTAIGGNLPTAPAMMGNVVVWKPASTAMLSAYYVMKILKEAGLPDGVINLLPGSGAEIGNPVLDNPDFAGLHFTGSTSTFNNMWKRIGENLTKGIYKSYPRMVGETGGKDFIIANKDTDADALAVAMFRGAFEYQGQKCSAASRAYVPRSLWAGVKERMTKMASEIQMGDITDFRTFMGAVIDKSSYDNIVSYIEHAKAAKDAEIVIGGKYDDSVGYFIHPTVIEAKDPKYKSMVEEIFGPVLTVYVFEDDKLDETMKILDETSPYALTGAIFAKDRNIINKMSLALTNSAGNFYINDKPTGAVVGQQPFGGARASGTNDKAGSEYNLMRWISVRAIKENFVPPVDYKYPHMSEK